MKAMYCIAAAAAVTSAALAQPSIFTDLGTISLGATVDSGEVSLPLERFVWFRFELAESITPSTAWLDMDTFGPGVIANCEVALFDSQGTLIAEDNDSGGNGADQGPLWPAAMSFGSGSGLRVTNEPPGGTFSDGWSAANLDPGVYWACVAAYDAGFDDSWSVSVSSSATGAVRLKISTGHAEPTRWNERWSGTDAGILPPTAAVVRGQGELTTILCGFTEQKRSVDTFRIRICDPAAFRVEAEATTVNTDGGAGSGNGGGGWGLRLYLFDAESHPVLGVNRTGGSDNEATPRITTLEPLSPAQLTPGEYYLSVSPNCGGLNGQEASPYGAGGPMFIFGAVPSNQTVTPNGPGAGQPVVNWGRIGDCSLADSFIARLTLSGVCYVEDPCPADLAAPFGILNFFDLAAYIARYNAGCP